MIASGKIEEYDFVCHEPTIICWVNKYSKTKKIKGRFLRLNELSVFERLSENRSPKQATIRQPTEKLLIGDKMNSTGGVAPISTIKANREKSFLFTFNFAKFIALAV